MSRQIGNSINLFFRSLKYYIKMKQNLYIIINNKENGEKFHELLKLLKSFSGQEEENNNEL